MSDYTKSTNFTAKDALSSGDPLKLIKGTYFDTEFDNIATAIATKYDSTDIASQAQAEAESSNTVLMTPGRLAQWADYNAGMVGDIQALTDPGADVLLGWDDSASAAIGFTLGAGLSHAATELNVADAIAGAGLTIASSVLAVGAGDGITVNADDVALTDVAASATNPVVISSGTFSFDVSSITEINITGINMTQDGILVSNNGVLNVLPLDESGIDVQTFTLDDELDATHANIMYLLTGATNKTLDIPANAVVAFHIGTQIIVGSRDTATLTVSPDTDVTLTSYLRSASDTSGDHTVQPGGQALLTKVATNEWMIVGNIG